MGKYSLPTTFILLITLANLLTSLAHYSNCPPPEHSPKFPPKHPPKVKPPFHPKPPKPPSTPAPVVPKPPVVVPKPPPVVVHPPPPYVPKLPPPVVVHPPPPYVPKLPPPVVVQPPPPYVPKLPPPVVVQPPPPYGPKLPPPVVVKPPPTVTPCPPPPPPKKDTCPIDALKLGACVDVLGGLVHIGIGSSAKEACCPVLQGLVDLDAALCLCTTIKAKLLNVNILIPIALQVLIDCGKYPPAGFQCPP